MVEKTKGLWMGSLIFAVLGAVAAIILSLYVYVRTQEDRSKGEQLKRPNAIMAFFLTLFDLLADVGLQQESLQEARRKGAMSMCIDKIVIDSITSRQPRPTLDWTESMERHSRRIEPSSPSKF